MLIFEKWFGFPLEIVKGLKILEKLFGAEDLSSWYERNLIMIMAPGAFIALGFLIALFNVLKPPEPEENNS